jgi:hypothetical protein
MASTATKRGPSGASVQSCCGRLARRLRNCRGPSPPATLRQTLKPPNDREGYAIKNAHVRAAAETLMRPRKLKRNKHSHFVVAWLATPWR